MRGLGIVWKKFPADCEKGDGVITLLIPINKKAMIENVLNL